MKQKSLQSFLVEYSDVFDLDDLVIEQQYSMRSYETGLYDIQSDGNLRSILNILSEIPLQFRKIFITVPFEDQLKNGIDDIEWLTAQNPKFVPIRCKYAVNALENRKQDVASQLRHEGELVLTYFSIRNREHTVFICPGSPRPENPLYSMAEQPWFQKQVNEATATFFFNANQDIYRGSKERIFEISEFVKVDKLHKFIDAANTDAYERLVQWNVDIYFPYRLTDADYGFFKLLAEQPNSIIGVTDPNNSLDNIDLAEEYRRRIVKLDPKRHIEYLSAIYFNPQTQHIKVYMSADLTKTIHMGPVETFIYFSDNNDALQFPSDWDRVKINQVRYEAYRAAIAKQSHGIRTH